MQVILAKYKNEIVSVYLFIFLSDGFKFITVHYSKIFSNDQNRQNSLHILVFSP